MQPVTARAKRVPFPMAILKSNEKISSFRFISDSRFSFCRDFFVSQVFAPEGRKIVVCAKGEKYAYSSGAEGLYDVQGAIGTTTFEIKNGKVRIEDSACPNKDCIRQGFDGTLVCLPNDVIITIENADGETDGEKGKFDAVSF